MGGSGDSKDISEMSGMLLAILIYLSTFLQKIDSLNYE